MADEVALSPQLAETRDSIRSRIFSTKQLKTKEIDFFGVKIELRQPSLASAFVQKEESDNNKLLIVGNLIDCAFVPGTSTKVFEDADYDSLVALPFGEDFVRVTNAIAEITGTNLQVTAGSSSKDQPST